MQRIEKITQKIHRQQIREATKRCIHLNEAARRIQLIYREFAHRSMQEKHKAAIEIQRHWRGYAAKVYCEQVRVQQEIELKLCAGKLIARFLGYLIYRRRQIKWHQQLEIAAVRIQCEIRQYIAKKQYDKLVRTQQQKIIEFEAAIRIQANVKMYITRRMYLDVLYVICRIQAVIRSYLVRKQVQRLLEEIASTSRDLKTEDVGDTHVVHAGSPQKQQRAETLTSASKAEYKDNDLSLMSQRHETDIMAPRFQKLHKTDTLTSGSRKKEASSGDPRATLAEYTQ